MRANDLPQSMTLRKGDEVLILWVMTEDQAIEVTLRFPSVQQHFDQRHYRTWQVARKNFSGEEGAALVNAHLKEAEREIEAAEDAAPHTKISQLRLIRDRLSISHQDLRGSLDPDDRRHFVEELRILRQEIAMVCDSPEARRYLLRHRLQVQRNFYDRDIREHATGDQLAQISGLMRTAESTLELGDFATSTNLIDRIQALYWNHGLDQEGFCGEQFMRERENRHLARDPAAFDTHVIAGNKALDVKDIQATRRALINIVVDQIVVGADIIGPQLASLMRA